MDASGVKVCDSCASAVCNTCMAENEVCCLFCLETFPVAALSDVLDGSRVHWPVPFERKNVAGAVLHSGGDTQPFVTVAKGHPNADEHEWTQNDQSRVVKHSPLANHLQSPLTTSPHTPPQMQQNAGLDSGEASPHTPPQMQQMAGNTNSRILLPLYEPTSQLEMERTHSDDDVSVKATTTMMFCNIPCRASREEVVQVIDSAGFADMYDFIYLPGLSGFKSSNIGYAFVDLKSPQFAREFARVMEGFQFPGRRSAKKCTVKRADKQHFNRQSRKGNAC